MTLAIVLVIAAVLALAAIVRISVAQRMQVARAANLGAQIRALDVEAFRNLANPADDEYLRRRLPAAQFRMVRRERLRAMAAYVQIAGSNAAVLVRMGEAALASGDPRTLTAARELVNDALLLRRNAIVALARIYIALALPSYGLAAERVADHYDRLGRSAMLLGRLQNPGLPVRIAVPR
jgi:hypothetical protein